MSETFMEFGNSAKKEAKLNAKLASETCQSICYKLYQIMTRSMTALSIHLNKKDGKWVCHMAACASNDISHEKATVDKAIVDKFLLDKNLMLDAMEKAVRSVELLERRSTLDFNAMKCVVLYTGQAYSSYGNMDPNKTIESVFGFTKELVSGEDPNVKEFTVS